MQSYQFTTDGGLTTAEKKQNSRVIVSFQHDGLTALFYISMDK